MDIEFICRSNPNLQAKLEKLGHDPNTLFEISKNYLKLCEDLDLTSEQSAELFTRIKNVHDYFKGSQTYNIVMYENSRHCPSRLCVENITSKKSVYFSVAPEQSPTEKKNVYYNCETCTYIKIKRSEVRTHFLEYHN